MLASFNYTTNMSWLINIIELKSVAEWRRILPDTGRPHKEATEYGCKYSRQSNTPHSTECLNGTLPIPIRLLH